jgi:hypothetical protein
MKKILKFSKKLMVQSILLKTLEAAELSDTKSELKTLVDLENSRLFWNTLTLECQSKLKGFRLKLKAV